MSEAAVNEALAKICEHYLQRTLTDQEKRLTLLHYKKARGETPRQKIFDTVRYITGIVPEVIEKRSASSDNLNRLVVDAEIAIRKWKP